MDNGASSQAGWQGDVADLKAGLAALGRPTHTLVISAAGLAFAPGYNMQRLVEHGITRSKQPSTLVTPRAH